ncbi:hypothetical protein [Nocardia sp. NPDC020380]|uniref:hypothetical protein n=1 Tax=Nocardia sp. NPDC020380 TaxID=3364309 RepID=UPI0037AE28AC
MEATAREWDPLIAPDMFQECSIADLRYVPLAATVGVIIDLRTALQLDEGNIGLLIVEGVTEIRVSDESAFEHVMMRTIVGSSPTVD